MFDTMKLTKITAALCAPLLILLLVKMGVDSIYSSGGGHGEEHAQGYVIATGESETAADSGTEGPSTAEILAAGDPAKGEKIFAKCKACHKVEDGANATGPHLYGVVGRKVDSAAGYTYSGALEAVADVWTPANLYAFLENPKGYAPGTTMSFAGLAKPEDRADLIAYLDELDGSRFVDPDAAAVKAESATETASAEESKPAEAAPAEKAAAEEAPATPAPAEEPAKKEDAKPEAAAQDTASGAAAVQSASVAEADLAAGEKLFKRCAACHKLEEGKNAAGPYLFAVVGRDIASAEGFKYSESLLGLEGNWTPEKLSAWLENPREFAPGNKMAFPGLKDEKERIDLIGYLQSVGN